MQVRRGFLVEKTRSGNMIPLLLKVREEDIVGSSGKTWSSEVVEKKSGWTCITRSSTDDKRVVLKRRFTIDDIKYLDTDVSYADVQLPIKIDIGSCVASINKECNGNKLFGLCTAEIVLMPIDGTSFTNSLRIYMYNPKSTFTNGNVTAESISISMYLDSYTK